LILERTALTLDARRLAVLVFEGTSIAVEQDAREALAQRALSDLIAQAETGHVLQLVARFDISEINPTGFVGTYVRALKRYESARQGHRAFSSEHAPLPLSSGELAAAYTRAADEFANALNAHDTRDYPRAEGSVRMLAGLSYFYAGPRNQNMIAASEQFVLTSDFLHAHDPARAANALWMAIRSLDIHLETIGSSDPSVRERRLAILARFLGQYPEHPRASNLVYQRAISGELPPERSIDDLLGITRSSSALARSTSNLYWKPEQPPPSTLMRSIAPSPSDLRMAPIRFAARSEMVTPAAEASSVAVIIGLRNRGI